MHILHMEDAHLLLIEYGHLSSVFLLCWTKKSSWFLGEASTIYINGEYKDHYQKLKVSLFGIFVQDTQKPGCHRDKGGMSRRMSLLQEFNAGSVWQCLPTVAHQILFKKAKKNRRWIDTYDRHGTYQHLNEKINLSFFYIILL